MRITLLRYVFRASCFLSPVSCLVFPLSRLLYSFLRPPDPPRGSELDPRGGEGVAHATIQLPSDAYLA